MPKGAHAAKGARSPKNQKAQAVQKKSLPLSLDSLPKIPKLNLGLKDPAIPKLQRGAKDPAAGRLAKGPKPAKAAAAEKAPAPQRARQQRSAAPDFNTPALWTKGEGRSRQGRGSAGPSLGAPALQTRGGGRRGGGPKAPNVPFALNNAVKLVLGVVLALVLLIGVDAGLNWGKVLPGVQVGGVDLSGLTVAQAQEKLSQVYQGRIYQGVVTIYAGEEQKEAVKNGQVKDLGPEEQLSVEEVQANTQKWDITPAELGAAVDYAARSQAAFEVGRGDGLFLGRLNALFGGVKLDLDLTFDEAKVEDFAQKIDKTIGDPRVDWNIKVEEGKASVTEGHDGYMVDRDELSGNIRQVVLTSENGCGEFVANAPYTPLRIEQEAAEAVRDRVNNAIADGAVIVYQNTSWQASAADVGSWVATRVQERKGGWELVPYIDENASRASIVHQLKQTADKKGITVRFTVDGPEPTVHITGEGTMPQIPQAAHDLTVALFGDDQNPAQDGAKEADGNPVTIQVGVGPIPQTMPFQEALDSGVIEQISSFTTEYNTGDGTEARVNNIHVAADELNNSICPAGGSWSFNQVAGESTEEKGFQAAGSIMDGEYVDSIGGGVCQVATTVFNAVYEAGFPVPKRRNHSLYIASYPEGRDAAVSWPDLDLEWTNPTESDVLMRTSYTDSSVTVALYGISPGYTVETKVGDWEPGRKFKKVTKKDPDYPEGYTELQTTGTNGSIVSVIRIVKDADGEIVSEDTFTSEYDPKDEVTLLGTGGGESGSYTEDYGE